MSVGRRFLRMTKALMNKHLPFMISCAEFDQFVLDYTEDRLPEMQKKVFELHLRMCADCRRYLHAYGQAVLLGKKVLGMPADPVPEEVPEDLVAAILSAKKARP